jgi:hypothetical protein
MSKICRYFFQNIDFFFQNIDFFFQNIDFFFQNIDFFFQNIDFFEKCKKIKINLLVCGTRLFFCLISIKRGVDARNAILGGVLGES